MIREALAAFVLAIATGCVAVGSLVDPPAAARASSPYWHAQAWRLRADHGDDLAAASVQTRAEVEPVIASEVALPAIEPARWLAFEHDPARARFVVDERIAIERSGAVEAVTSWYRRSATTLADARRGTAIAPREAVDVEHVWQHPGRGFTALSLQHSYLHAEQCGEDSFSITATDGRRGRQITFAGRPRAAAFTADGSLLVSAGRARATAYSYGVTTAPSRWPRGDRTVRVAPGGEVTPISRAGFDAIAAVGSDRVWGVQRQLRGATLVGLRGDGEPFFRTRVDGHAHEPLPTNFGVCMIVEPRARRPTFVRSPTATLQCWRDDGTLRSTRQLARPAAVLVMLDGTIFVGTATALTSYDADGRERWRLPLAVGSALTLTELGELCTITAAPRRLVCLRGRVTDD